jgi:UDP-GlcNAc:undecaprenyl-phosphate/decaprenyl-phosphate GlcNAc-1-phosphate transferase
MPLAVKILMRALIAVYLVVLSLPPIKTYYFNLGGRWFYILIFSFLTCYFLTPFCRMAAIRFGIVDKPDWRKMHSNDTPLLGGLAVYLAFLLSILLNNIYLPGMKIILLAGSLMLAMGLLDDIRPIPAIVKLVLQILFSLIVIILGNIHFTFFYHSSWAPLINVPLTVLWIVGITNAMNFFDGLDGLASTLSIIIAFYLCVISFMTYQPNLGWFSVALAGSCIGFMPYNFRIRQPAQIFLGDAGSTFTGFTLACLAVLGKWSPSSNFVSLTAPVLIFGVLIFDMSYVNLSRIKNRLAGNFIQLINCANKDHLHHRLLMMGFLKKEVVYVISLMCTCLGVSAIIIMRQNTTEAVLGLGQAIMILGLIVVLMLKGREKLPKEGERRKGPRRQSDRLLVD